MDTDVSALRREYKQASLREQDVAPTWFLQLRQWLNHAVAAQVLEPNAMTLATVDADGLPDARVVLLKGLTESGLTFFTNRQSTKGQQLLSHPHAALVFWWGELERSVRIRGTVTPVTREEDQAYFQTRPRGSQLGAWASPQSRVVPDRGSLEALLEGAQKRFGDGPVDCPAHWGGYRVAPTAVEFWQGQRSRLHDRIRFRLEGSSWVRERLGA